MEPKRPNNRFVFESSLELKCLFFFGVALAIVITINFCLYFKVTKTQIDTQNPLMGKLLCEREFLVMHLRVLLKSKPGDETLSDSENSDVDDFIDSMTSRSEEISGLTEREKFEWRLIRVAKRRPNADDAPKDEFEEKLLDSLIPIPPSGETVSYRERTDEDGRYHYYQPLRAERSCLNCHKRIMEDSSVDLGSLLGIIQVVIPEPPSQREITRLWALLLGAAIVTAFLGLIAFYVVIRWVVIRPLRSLRDVSEAISRGDISKRADLHTGDEFETLGVAFNRMLRHLVNTQEKLRSINIELENKVDQLAQLNLQLFETNRVKSDFMATMSHELRTPLNSIIGFSDVLSALPSLDDKQKRYVGNISKSGRTLLNMINDVLDMARIEAGRLEVQIARFQIEAVVLAQCDMAKPLADKKNLDLIPEIEPNLPPMRQDETKIQQIVNNLLSNAIKFTPEGGRIRVQIRRKTAVPLYPRSFGTAGQSGRINSSVTTEQIPFLELKVVDSGVGISEEDKAIIFEKFRQGKASAIEGDAMTREYSGSGLGLSIVKELCKLLEGEVGVESQPGFGSEFTISLPWELNPPIRTESPMQTEIQKFVQAGTSPRKGTQTFERPRD